MRYRIGISFSIKFFKINEFYFTSMKRSIANFVAFQSCLTVEYTNTKKNSRSTIK